MKKTGRMIALVLCVFLYGVIATASASGTDVPRIEQLVGEHLKYDISFLWFDHLAEGSLELVKGDQPGTYLVTLQAKTLGVAAFVTRKRSVRFQTLMATGANGELYPLWHSSHDIRGEGAGQKERITRYTFDFTAKTVRYQKQKNGRVYTDKWFDLSSDQPVYDILTALYDFRLGYFGTIRQQRILIPTFHHDGSQDIVIEPVDLDNLADRSFFSGPQVVSKILVDPSVFGTNSRDIYASFDRDNRPFKGIIKNVIGLGDVKGTLRHF